MKKIFKSLRRNGKGNLRITNENATGCICIEIVFNWYTVDIFNFERTAFSQCKFQERTFLASNLNAIEIYQSNFDNCVFIKSDFSDSKINKTNFYLYQMEETSFDEAYLENCNFQDTKFKNMDTRGLCVCNILEDSKISMEGW